MEADSLRKYEYRILRVENLISTQRSERERVRTVRTWNRFITADARLEKLEAYRDQQRGRYIRLREK